MSDKIAPNGWEVKRLGDVLKLDNGKQIIATLSQQLVEEFGGILIKNELQREFYTQMCCDEQWSVRLGNQRKTTYPIFSKNWQQICVHLRLSAVCFSKYCCNIFRYCLSVHSHPGVNP